MFIPLNERSKYATYNPKNPGCSQSNPIVISETEGYVHLEYEILDALLRPIPFRNAEYKFVGQRLEIQGDRKLDVLTVNVYHRPVVDVDEDGNLVRSEPILQSVEEYWFDITAGYDAL